MVNKLVWSCKIFCALFEKKDTNRDAKECDVRKAHQEFFLAMHDSLLCGFCVATTLLFSEKEKATSICNLIKDIEESKPGLATMLNEKIRDFRANGDAIGKVEVIRQQACAHRWKAKTPQEVFAEAGLRLSMMKEVADLSRFIICELAKEAGKEDLEKQQLSEETLQRIADDASRVMDAFVETA